MPVAAKKVSKTVTITSTERVAKKSVVRFNFPEGGAITSLYVDNDADKALGNPETITVTIAAA